MPQGTGTSLVLSWLLKKNVIWCGLFRDGGDPRASHVKTEGLLCPHDNLVWEETRLSKSPVLSDLYSRRVRVSVPLLLESHPRSVHLFCSGRIKVSILRIEMAMKVTNLDKRHKGHKHGFKWSVEPLYPWQYPSGSVPSSFRVFADWRDSCWESLGAGIEISRVSERPDTRWAWDLDGADGKYRIYFRHGTDFSWFRLKWGT